MSASRGDGAPRRLAEVLAEIPGLSRMAAARGRERVEEAWREAAGTEAARVTRPEGLRGGVLTVLVQGSAWLHEIRAFRVAAIRERLRTAHGLPVDRIRFRLEPPAPPA